MVAKEIAMATIQDKIMYKTNRGVKTRAINFCKRPPDFFRHALWVATMEVVVKTLAIISVIGMIQKYRFKVWSMLCNESIALSEPVMTFWTAEMLFQTTESS